MNQASVVRNIYGLRPHNEQDRKRMLAFANKEKECDEHNELQIAMINKEHLSKTKLKQCESMVKRWKKESSTMLKRLSTANVKYSTLSLERTWIIL